MPPRKSLPAPRATPHRPIPKRGQSSTPAARSKLAELPRKRQRREVVEDDLESIEAEPTTATTDNVAEIVDEVVAKPMDTGSMDPEKELEHWQDFAVEHYEMVEQLPLELHRNYRLLRELDDGVAVHSEKLQTAIREYIAYRLDEPVKSQLNSSADVAVIPPMPSLSLNGDSSFQGATKTREPLSIVDDAAIPVGQGGQTMSAPETAATLITGAGQRAEDGSIVAQDPVLEPSGGPLGMEEAYAIMDAEAEEDIGEVEQVIEEDQGRRPFPLVSPNRPEAAFLPPQAIRQDEPESSTAGRNKDEVSRRWALLPEIAKLAKDMVKNAEEKVAVAQGAYNSIDRHIRALDSALSSQEASILLGLRPSTLPSAAVEALEAGAPGALTGGEEITLGTGGGGARRKGRAQRGRNRKGAVDRAEVDALADAAVLEAEEQPLVAEVIDPNEPRYCYCNQVSFGEMIGCDNEDCKIEWFHLTCVNMTSAPTGTWYCNVCIGEAQAGKTKVKPDGTANRGKGRGARGKGRGRPSR